MNITNHSASTHSITGLRPGDAGQTAVKEQGSASHTASMMLQDVDHDNASQITALSGRSRVHSSAPIEPAVPMAITVLNASVDMPSLARTSSDSSVASGAHSDAQELPLLVRVVDVHPRTPRSPETENATAAQLQRMESGISMSSLDTFQSTRSASGLDSVSSEGRPNLVSEYAVHPRAPQTRSADDINIAQLQRMESGISMATLSDAPVTESSTATQTDATKSSALHRYGPLVASSLAAILGAVLTIVAKTHGHDEMETDEAGDIQPQAPDYDAIGQQAAQDAEQAFVDKWHDPEMWGPGKVDGDGVNLETGEKNPYYEAVRNQETGEFAIGDTLSPEGERTLGELRETAAASAIDQAKADYEQALEDASAHNAEHTSGTLRDEKSGKDHDAMLGVGATLIGLGGLATTLIAGNKLTHRSHDKQQAQGIQPEHGSLKTFVEQKLFQVRA